MIDTPSSDGVILGGDLKVIETVFIETRRGIGSGYYKNTVLEATTDGHGHVRFDYAKSTDWKKLAKTNKTNHVTYQVQAGALDGEIFGLDLSKVSSVSGHTYTLKDSLKSSGLKWNPTLKIWER